MKHWIHSPSKGHPFVFILSCTAPRSCFQTFYFSPFKRGRTNKQIWRLLACLSVSNHTDRTDRRDRQAACGMMNKELISVAQKEARHISNPAQFTAGHHISQPACLHVSLHCCLSHSGRLSLSLSLWQPDTVFVAILVFLCTAQCACVCHSCICWETHTSAHWSHSASPLIKTHAFSSITVTKTERNPHKKTLNITADILTQPLQFLRFCCHCWKRSVATSTSFLNGTCGLLGPWRNAYFAPFMNVLI